MENWLIGSETQADTQEPVRDQRRSSDKPVRSGEPNLATKVVVGAIAGGVVVGIAALALTFAVFGVGHLIEAVQELTNG
jgi:hypothetical protein